MASASSIRKTFEDIHVRNRLPESVSITSLPKNANVYIGENIDPDILVIPVEALVPLQFPLSSLFLDFFDYIKIPPLQQAPLAYRILAYCEAISRLRLKGYLSPLVLVPHFYKLLEDGHCYYLHPHSDKNSHNV
ncbi:hypothetical protein TIFTF001_024136 [Ficus carica]|uniref:Uncharacterized protein n=1 Tax=Ficus carica TaxID=3494 RepID=A0AA88ALM2_FICCA|nr:hypothetical protein TIFTF001_024136 [Ficus carica]